MNQIFAFLICGLAVYAQSPNSPTRQTLEQTERSNAGGQGSQAPALLIDHGGPVLSSSSTFAIYWGQPGDFPVDLTTGMQSLFGGFNGSSYLGIAEQYMHSNPIQSTYGGMISDTSAPPSHAPKTADLGAEVCKLFPNPVSNGIYFVFTSNAPHVNFCAWHDKATCNGVTFQVAYIPNQALLPGCSPYTRVNLGCNDYSDGTVSSADSVAHEFMEAVTDPQLNAWFDKNGQEMADKCNFNYSACVTLSSGMPWQIQSEWSNQLKACQQQ